MVRTAFVFPKSWAHGADDRHDGIAQSHPFRLQLGDLARLDGDMESIHDEKPHDFHLTNESSTALPDLVIFNDSGVALTPIDRLVHNRNAKTPGKPKP